MLSRWSTIVTVALLSSAALAALPGSVGTGQKVGVIVARYPDGPEPQLSSEQWRDGLNQWVNPFYTRASGGLTNFEFIAVSGVLDFDFDYIADDLPAAANFVVSTVFREAQAAAQFAESKGINLADVTRLLVISTSPFRGLSTAGHWPIYQTSLGPFTPLAFSMVQESDGELLLNPVADPSDQLRFQIGTPAHELGHQLGLFDLYNEFSPPEFTEAWSMMGIQSLQHFDAFSRRRLDWLPASRIVTLGMPLQGTIDQTFNLVAPGTPGQSPQAVRFSFLPQPISAVADAAGWQFHGIQAEARPRIGLDAQLVQQYQPGVLLSMVNEGFPLGSFVVQPRAASNSSRLELDQAALIPGSSYQNNDMGLSITALPGSGASLPIRVRWTSPPRPDLAIHLDTPLGESRDIWLDSPSNGFGTFFFPNFPGDAVPSLCGDFPFVPYVVPWNDPDGNGPLPALPGLPEPRPVDHRLNIRVSNIGTAPAQNVRGHVVFLEPGLPAFDWEHPETLLDIGTRADFQINSLPANASAIRQITVRPKGNPFLAICWFDRVVGEINLSNQLAGEAFIISQPAPGSPYDPVQVDLKLTNLLKQAKLRELVATPSGVPSSWQGETNSYHFSVRQGDNATFKIVFRAPADDKPRLVRPSLTGWMNFGDSFVKIGELPVYVDLSRRTKLDLAIKDGGADASFVATLRPAQQGLPITIVVSGNDGSVQFVGTEPPRIAFLQTSSKGVVTGSVKLKKGISYQAVATFDGAEGFSPSQSEPISFGVRLALSPRTNRPNVKQ